MYNLSVYDICTFVLVVSVFRLDQEAICCWLSPKLIISHHGRQQGAGGNEPLEFENDDVMYRSPCTIP